VQALLLQLLLQLVHKLLLLGVLASRQPSCARDLAAPTQLVGVHAGSRGCRSPHSLQQGGSGGSNHLSSDMTATWQ